MELSLRALDRDGGLKAQDAKEVRQAVVGTWYSIFPSADFIADPQPPF